jgi:hypothetical protein
MRDHAGETGRNAILYANRASRIPKKGPNARLTRFQTLEDAE